MSPDGSSQEIIVERREWTETRLVRMHPWVVSGSVAGLVLIPLGMLWGLGTQSQAQSPEPRSKGAETKPSRRPSGRGDGHHRSPRHNPTGGMDPLEGRPLMAEDPIAVFAPVVAEVSSEITSHALPTLYEAVDDSFLNQALYCTPGRLASKIAPSGSIGLNTDYEAGLSTKWYIELQRYGGDLVQAGLVSGDAAVVQRGWAILDWGFQRQRADGGFEGTCDAFHSTSLFVEGAARALLLTVQSGAADAPARLKTYLPKIEAAASWLLDPARVAKVEVYQSQYTHRRWLLAAGMGETAALARYRATLSEPGDWAARAAAFEAEGIRYAKLGMAMQRSDGLNPEKGGGDVSYQVFGTLMAQRYLTTGAAAAVEDEVRTSVVSALKWSEQFIAADGTVDIDGSTRTGVETTWNGTTKSIDYKAIVQAFSMATTVTGDPTFRMIAKAVASGRGWYKA